MVSVFSHNSKHYANNRDCYEVGPLPERARRALVTWLHNSVVKEMSYVYPQYYVTTYNARSKEGRLSGEVAWGILSDGKGNMLGVLVPTDKRIPAWDMPSIGSFKVYVCETSARKELSDAIMETLADAQYDTTRINSLKATGLDDQNYLISKPGTQAQQDKSKAEEKSEQKEQGGEESKVSEDTKTDESTDSSASSESDTSSESSDTSSSDNEEDSSGESDDSSDDSSGDNSDSGSEEDSGSVGEGADAE